MRASFAWAVAALPIVIVCGLVLFVTVRPVVVLPRQGLVPAFALSDQHGALLTSEALRGAVVLYAFARDCTADCAPPALLTGLNERLDAQPMTSLDVRFVTFAAQTSPSSAAAKATTAGLPRWSLLQGDSDQVQQIVSSGFGGVEGTGQTGLLLPPPTFMLVDGWGIVRADYRRTTPSVDQLLRDIQLVVDEARQSDGAARYAYEAAHLLACYAR
jgi:protein SCO1/2